MTLPDQDIYRRANFGAAQRDQWGIPLMTQMPEGNGPFAQVDLQTTALANKKVVWRFRRMDNYWAFVGGGDWTTWSEVDVNVNEATLASAISTDRYSALDRFVIPQTGNYLIQFHATMFNDTSNSWVDAYTGVANVATETYLFSVTHTSYDGGLQIRNTGSDKAPFYLEKGTELGLFSYRETQIWAVNNFGWSIKPLNLDIN